MKLLWILGITLLLASSPAFANGGDDGGKPDQTGGNPNEFLRSVQKEDRAHILSGTDSIGPKILESDAKD